MGKVLVSKTVNFLPPSTSIPYLRQSVVVITKVILLRNSGYIVPGVRRHYIITIIFSLKDNVMKLSSFPDQSSNCITYLRRICLKKIQSGLIELFSKGGAILAILAILGRNDRRNNALMVVLYYHNLF